MLVLGIGNEFRRDDGVGRRVAHALRRRALPGVRVMECSGEAVDLMMTWQDEPSVIVVDALTSGAPPGTIYRLDAWVDAVPASFFAQSSHAFGLAQAVALARTLGELPPRLVIYGVEGAEFGHGAGLTPQVAQSAEEVVRRIVEEVTHARTLSHDQLAPNH